MWTVLLWGVGALVVLALAVAAFLAFKLRARVPIFPGPPVVRRSSTFRLSGLLNSFVQTHYITGNMKEMLKHHHDGSMEDYFTQLFRVVCSNLLQN